MRGEFYAAHDTPATWGSQEAGQRPHYFICTISDRSASQVEAAGLFDRLYDSLNDEYDGPRYAMIPSEVNKADGKTYTWDEFTLVLDQYIMVSGQRKKI